MGYDIVVAISFLLVGILIGFLIGTRGRQIAASAKAIAMNWPSIPSLRIPPREEDEGKDEAEALGDEKEDDTADILEGFMARTMEPGLDDHPDLELNPVIMYQVREAKAAKRVEMMRAALREEGLTEEEIEDRMYLASIGGGGNATGTGRPSAFQVLIDAGARVTSASDKAADAALVEERKRQVRTIDVFLSKERGIDTTKDPGTVAQKSRELDPKKAGERPKTAYQVAHESRGNARDMQWRTSEMVGVAKRGRNQMRAQKSKIKYVYKKEKKDPKQAKRGAMELKAEDLASIASEFEEGKLGGQAAPGDEDAEALEDQEYQTELARIEGDISSDDELMFA